MGRTGKFTSSDLKKLQRQLNKIQAEEADVFVESCAKELAARLLALVIPRTPVGDYSKEVTVTVKRDGKHHKKGDTYTKRVTPSGKKGGTLRRGWTARTEQEAASRGGNSNAKAYAQALPIKKQGGSYLVEVINPVHYASYVEFGHRTPGGKGWVAGQYFLTLSEQDLRALAPALIEKKLEALLREVFRV